MKGLVFSDPNSGKSFSIRDQNMELHQERGNRRLLVGVCADESEEDKEAFSLEIACELTGETPQRDGIQVVHRNK
jgi:hypothetical protein